MAEVNPKDLKAAIKALNNTGALESKIKIVGTKTADLVALFTEAVEAMHEEEMEIPDEAILVYNAMDGEGKEEEPESKQEEKPKQKKKAPAKKPAKKKAEAPKKKAATKKQEPTKSKSATSEKDDFGYAVGCRNSLFCKAIKKKMMTMKEVKELDWNEKNATFYTVFNQLVESGVAEKDKKTGKMKIKK